MDKGFRSTGDSFRFYKVIGLTMTGTRQEGSAVGSDILISVTAGDGQSLIYHQNIWAWDECSSGHLAWHLRVNIWTHEPDLMTLYSKHKFTND